MRNFCEVMNRKKFTNNKAKKFNAFLGESLHFKEMMIKKLIVTTNLVNS